jgi:hypothetical protein
MPRFLVHVDLGPNPPTPDAMAEAVSAAQEWVRNEDRVELAYAYPEGGGCAIINAESQEELQALLITNPATGFLRYKVQPMVDFDTGMDQLVRGRGGRPPRW